MTATKHKRRRPTLGYVLELERLLMIEQNARKSAQEEAITLARRIQLLREESLRNWVAKVNAETDYELLQSERSQARAAVAKWLGVKVPT